MPTDDDTEVRMSLLEFDFPAPKAPTPDAPTPVPLLDLVDDVTHPVCLSCNQAVPVNELSICQSCTAATEATASQPFVDFEMDWGGDNEEAEALVAAVEADAAEGLAAQIGGELGVLAAAIATESAANAATKTIGSIGGGQMLYAGFRNAEGYATAIRNGVGATTHSQYLTVLRFGYGWTDAQIAELPGPSAAMVTPTGSPGGGTVNDPVAKTGIYATHVPTVIGPRNEAERAEAPRLSMNAAEIVAGFGETASHVIVAWSGSSDATRGQLLAALEGIGRTSWAPKAPEAKAQAGAAINTLGRHGLHIKAQRKAGRQTSLETNEHVWTVGEIDHTGVVGDKYGQTLIRFRLKDGVMTFDAHQADSRYTTLANEVVVAFNARMAAEVMPTSRITGWLRNVLRTELVAVPFGAMGYLVAKKHAAAAGQLCEAVSTVFGYGWVTGMPVTDCEQLRDGLARGLRDEVTELLHRLKGERERAAEERNKALEARAARVAAGEENVPEVTAKGDIGTDRATTHLRDLRAIGARVVAWGQVLGERLFVRCKDEVREAMASLEELLGEDYTGIRARFEGIWEEIERDRLATGGVL